MKEVVLFVLLVAVPLSLPAQVEHKREWMPVREVRATAPPPPHLEERVRRFEERDSAEAMEGLARELFGLINPDYLPAKERQAELYRAAWKHYRAREFSAALESYKLFSFDRIRHPAEGVKIDPADPAKRTFIEFYNTADELMRGVFRFQVFDKPIAAEIWAKGTDSVINFFRAGKHNAHMIDVVLQNGQPGRMNWTYKVPGFFSSTWHIQGEEGYYAVAYRQSMCFAPLLVAYLEKRDATYFRQWAGYMEDQLLNYRRDLAEAGIKMPTTPAGVTGVDIRHLFFLVLNAPEIDRDFPATTFVRLQLAHWIEDLPLIVLGSRATGANRAMHMYGALLTDARMRFPELNQSDDLLEERRRILESYARQYMMPDGTSVDYAPNYNKNYINSPPGDMKFLREMKDPPVWYSQAWEEELNRERRIMARYLIHAIAPDGTLPGYKDPVRAHVDQTVGPNGYLAKSLPSSLTDPVNVAVVKNLLEKAAAADPGFVSEAFPYGGYYVMRENWSPDTRYLYFHDYRPGENGSWRHHKNIFVQAFGQRMLNAFRWESPLLVDGAGHIHNPLVDLYPKSYEGKRGLFGSHAELSAWQEPLPNRWHTSAQFDLAEGNLKIPFAEKFDDRPSVFVDDVTHGRQVVFLRDAGAWIVTDRITAEKPHDFKLLWGFEADLINPPGWEKDWRNKNKKATGPNAKAYSKEQIVVDPAAQVIHTENPQRPNLSIHHAASLPLRLTPGEVLQNNDSMFGNTYRVGPDFQTDRSAVVASLLYPRQTGAPDVVSFQPVKVADGAGFDAVTPGGVSVQYRAGLQARDLTAGTISAQASTLVVSQAKGSPTSGLALDCSTLTVAGKSLPVPSADFEFAIAKDGSLSFQPIFRPMAPVKILPERDVFLGSMEVTFTHPEKDVEIRYTLDGSDPTLESPVFANPIPLDKTTTVRAIAIRKGVKTLPPTTDSTQASLPATAVFSRAPELWPAIKEEAGEPGLAFQYYEDDWTLSLLKLPVLEPVKKGVAKEWMDISSVRKNPHPYAFVYEGYLNVPADGVYTFHGPREFFDVGERVTYDLKVEVDGKPWYPGSRAHNYGNWSVPLAAGPHRLRVSYVDLRRATRQTNLTTSFTGEKPQIAISGPGLPPQPVPAAWLSHP
jgi:hypothetical protein